jgi:outer membrane protein TolC/ABC-type uncharacterized transport system substrate-binding protein
MTHWHRVLGLVLGLSSCVHAINAQQPTGRPVTFGLLVDGPSERNAEFRALFHQEITDLLSGEFAPAFPSGKELIADWTQPGVARALDQLFADPAVDIIITMGVIASHEAAGREVLAKPVVAPFVLDADLQNLPRENGTSGVPNLTYVMIPTHFDRDIEVFREVVQFEKVAVLVNQPYADAIPTLGQMINETLQTSGWDGLVIGVDQSVDSALAALPADVDAVHVGVLTQVSTEEVRRLAQGLIARRLPSYTVLGDDGVRNGFLLSITPQSFWLRVARRTALNIQRILLGEAASTLPVAFAREERLAINMRTARAIRVFPSWAVLTEAVLIDAERTDIERRLTLLDAAQEAVERNLDLAAQEFVVAAGAQDIRAARSVLLPQAELSALGTLIDKDRAEASFGSQPQRTLTATVGVSQLLFSESAWANLSIQHRLQDLRIQQRNQLRLDVIEDAAVSYLAVLRAKTLERVQQDNLRVTRSNLELSRIRQTVGTASAGEVARWESEIARSRQDVIRANSQRNLAEIALNRLLQRPAEEAFVTEETTLEDASLVTSDPRFLTYLGDPSTFRHFRRFMTGEALASSPEIRQFDAAIAAQERALRSASNAFWAPTIALQGTLSNRLAEGGAGTDVSLSLPPGSPDLSGAFPRPDDTNWSVGLQFSYPLFTSGARSAARSQASAELSDLRTRRQATVERIEQRIRSTLHNLGASFAAIGLSQSGATAARRNLELVTDGYGRGVASVTDLLDAQNAALVADLGAANATYDFLIDLMQTERAAGNFDFFLTAEEREAYFERLEAFFAAIAEFQ